MSFFEENINNLINNLKSEKYFDMMKKYKKDFKNKVFLKII